MNKTATFAAENSVFNMDYINSCKEVVTHDVSNKDLWEDRIIIDTKYWVYDVPNTPNHRVLGKRLTPEECDIYNVGDNKNDYKVVAFGYKVFKNKETGEEVSCPWQMS